MGAVLIHNGKDAAQIVREGKISFHHAVLPDDDGVAVKVVELARYAVFHDLFVFPGIDRCTTAPNTIFVDPVLVRRLHEYLHLFVFMIIHLAIIELSYTT